MSDYHYDAIVTDVHDGDTVTVDVDLGFKAWLRGIRIRMYGINAPELSTPEGPVAQKFLAGLVALAPGRRVTLETFKDREDKYGGRWLGTLWIGGKNMNLAMIDGGHAKPYFGAGPKPL